MVEWLLLSQLMKGFKGKKEKLSSVRRPAELLQRDNSSAADVTSLRT